MAEFCLDCWNELNETNDPPEKYVISKEAEWCEGCGAYKPVIISPRRCYWLYATIKKVYLFFAGKRQHSVSVKARRQMEEEDAQK